MAVDAAWQPEVAVRMVNLFRDSRTSPSPIEFLPFPTPFALPASPDFAQQKLQEPLEDVFHLPP